MILDAISHSESTEMLGERFRQLFEYLRTHNLAEAPAGRVVIDGDALYINVEDATLRKREDQLLEVHRRYIDVHFPIDGLEVVGWSPLSELCEENAEAYNAERDFRFYRQAASTYFTAAPGHFYVMFPEDAHAPIIGEGKLRKAVAKIRID